MRILQLMNRVPWPLKDGGALGFYQYTKGYHEAGCDVTVCALNTNKHHVNMNSLPIELAEIATWYAVDINTDINPLDALLNLFSNKSYNIERFKSPDFASNLLHVLQSNAPFDIVIFEGLFMAQYIDIVRKNTSSVCILREHNVEYRIWETLANNASNPLKKAYLSLLARRMKKAEMQNLNRFDAITTVTEEDASHFSLMGCEKPVFVSPFGADLKRLMPDRSHEEPLSVFHLGSMEWLPNQQAMQWFIQKVWPRVLFNHPSATLYVAGRGMPQSFQQFAAPSIKIVGEVEDAVQFMKSKQIMIVPLFSGSGIRVKILEGMALGKTIVSTSLGAAGIAVENGKQLIIADDETQFIEALSHLLNHPNLARQIGENARELATSLYDNTKVINRALSFYQTLLKP